MIATRRTKSQHPGHARDTALASYQTLETALWAYYGVERTREHHVEIDVPKVRIRVTDVGAGRPILCVVGTGGTGPYWGALVRELDAVRWIILDRPGLGLSQPIDWSKYDYSTAVADIQTAVVDELDLDGVTVMGHSIGDLWALRFAQRQPSRVEQIVLMGSGPLTDDVVPPAFIRLLSTPLGAAVVRIPQRDRMTRSRLRSLGHGQSLDNGAIPELFISWRTSLSNDTPR